MDRDDAMRQRAWTLGLVGGVLAIVFAAAWTELQADPAPPVEPTVLADHHPAGR